MISRGKIAAKVRVHKEAHPDQYCSVPGCLWRTKTQRGDNPCQKHPVTPRGAYRKEEEAKQ